MDSYNVILEPGDQLGVVRNSCEDASGNRNCDVDCVALYWRDVTNILRDWGTPGRAMEGGMGEEDAMEAAGDVCRVM